MGRWLERGTSGDELENTSQVTKADARAEVAAFLEAFYHASAAKDLAASEALRTADYRSTTPDGKVWSRADEVAAIADQDLQVTSLTTHLHEVSASAGEAKATYDMFLRARLPDREMSEAYRCTLELVKDPRGWKANALSMQTLVELASTPPAPAPSLLRRIRNRVARKVSGSTTRGTSFQDIAYHAFRPGEDYALPRSAALQPAYEEAQLPIPPTELWLSYNYPSDGALHVRTMLDIASASGFSISPGDRILDLGCGAGRMIRHLAPYADRCGIWGADISVDHIYWCQRNLSPPFNFLTNTKVPHLPFRDGSFRFAYCGSLFTHIDDMAAAWLLEIHRLLAPDGRAYITIHDERSLELFDRDPEPPAFVQTFKASAMYSREGRGSDMFTVGRDESSQVFYARDYFSRLAAAAFDVLSATPEAYFYQTAFLLRPKVM